MESIESQEHWQKIYQTKALTEVSWYQPKPETSLQLIDNLQPHLYVKIIDVGGGDSFLVDCLLEKGFTNITVLDISSEAIERAQKRLGEKSKFIHWIVSDILDFKPIEIYDIWHDRAAFHFLTQESDIQKYISIASQSISESGNLIMGTFSTNGPLKCSGIEIQQYCEESMKNRFLSKFKPIYCEYIDHQTPFNTLQNFIFCVFKKNN